MATFLLFVTTDSSVPTTDDAAARPDVEQWWSTLNDAGRHHGGGPLAEVDQAQVVRVRGGEITATPGSVIAGSGAIAGFDIIEADDMAAAIEVAAGHPMAWSNAVEVRALVDLDLENC